MISTWSCGVADENMPEEILVGAKEKVERHPWWHARARLALATLKKHGVLAPAAIADVGCGWGTNLTALEQAGYQVVGFDISRRILEKIDNSQRQLVELDLNHDLPGEHALFEALMALDVIEHLDDDRGVVRRMAQLLKPNGLAVVSVPALPDLFSEFDSIQGHRRRYLPETLRATLTAAGLVVREIFWWGAWMVPVLRRMRHRSNACNAQVPTRPQKTYLDYLQLPPWPGPIIMKLAYQWEQRRALSGRLKTGTSLFAVAVRES